MSIAEQVLQALQGSREWRAPLPHERQRSLRGITHIANIDPQTVQPARTESVAPHSPSQSGQAVSERPANEFNDRLSEHGDEIRISRDRANTRYAVKPRRLAHTRAQRPPRISPGLFQNDGTVAPQIRRELWRLEYQRHQEFAAHVGVAQQTGLARQVLQIEIELLKQPGIQFTPQCLEHRTQASRRDPKLVKIVSTWVACRTPRRATCAIRKTSDKSCDGGSRFLKILTRGCGIR
jgi:hypothetical protein